MNPAITGQKYLPLEFLEACNESITSLELVTSGGWIPGISFGGGFSSSMSEQKPFKESHSVLHGKFLPCLQRGKARNAPELSQPLIFVPRTVKIIAAMVMTPILVLTDKKREFV